MWLKFCPTNNLVQNLNFKKRFFCFLEGIQFLAFQSNRYKNLKNGKILSSFLKYSPNIFSQNFAARKSVKGKLITVLLVGIFFTRLMTNKQLVIIYKGNNKV